jgi:NAD(P)-dependent dehydrogenase (short-subunit alcohol dehydrogenase family)
MLLYNNKNMSSFQDSSHHQRYGDLEEPETLSEGDLEGETAVVIGGASGIGKATAELYREAGANVVVGDKNEYTGEYDGIDWKNVDITDSDGLENTLEEIVGEYGEIDILTNTAGVAEAVPVGEEGPDAIDQKIDVNLTGPAYINDIAPDYMANEGDVIQTGSVWADDSIVVPGDASYTGSKAALIQHTRQSQTEAGEENDIRYNCVSPALTRTPMIEDIEGDFADVFTDNYDGRDTLFQPEEIAEVFGHIVRRNRSESKDPFEGKNIFRDAGFLEEVDTDEHGSIL